MTKITFLGAGSTVFAKNVLGDVMMTPRIENIEIALVDIDPARLEDSRIMLEKIRSETGRADIRIQSFMDRKEALKDSGYVINAIQVGGYDPCTITDFDIPKKYRLRQTIADTLGIGGIFRALRTIPVLQDFAHDMEEACPDALFINYSNPMAMLSGYLQQHTDIKTVGLCHSVQGCAGSLLRTLNMEESIEGMRWKISGINHQSWLLEIADRNGKDLYPEIRDRARRAFAGDASFNIDWDRVRLDLMLRTGFYNTESSEHTSEYNPWYIKAEYPELIEKYKIPLDEYPRRCIAQIKGWADMREEIVGGRTIGHTRTHEFAAFIIEAMETDIPYRIHGNVRNTGLITNLPAKACVEVPCFVDRNGINPCHVGDLPEICAAINRTSINVQLLTIEAALTRKKELVYQAAMMDPHTAAELSLDDIRSMCDDLFEAHGRWMPEFR
ncbi:MAG: alpha-galactosidase [Saccharofermentanales bacterium]